MARSTFSPLGLPVGDNNLNMTYLYGLSDFFSVMFENPDKINLLLEAGSEEASEVYSRFLQLTSNISLRDIESTSGETLKLITLKSTDAVAGEVNVYNLPVNLISSRYIANRPLLPTTLFETDVDYRVEKTAAGTFVIRFAKSLSSSGFSSRLLSDETTTEYALWLVDSAIDEQWISTYYGNLIGLDPQSSTDIFKNYVYGLYYLYANGPTIDLIKKGLNITLGIPLCRGEETVLDIRTYLETDLYVVITDKNQYVIPYGLPPAVEVGQELQLSDEIASWIEVKDYINDGAWWINLQIPSTIIPSIPPGQVDRYAKLNTQFDYLMRNYLKKHTFLVNVNVTYFKDSQIFTELATIIKEVKPSYTQAIYIWTVEKNEDATLLDNQLYQERAYTRTENLSLPIDQFFRNNSSSKVVRGNPQFLRCSISNNTSKLLGTDTYVNGASTFTHGGVSNGYLNFSGSYRENTETELGIFMALFNRGSDSARVSRSKIAFTRGIHTDFADDNYPGVGIHDPIGIIQTEVGARVIPLYITTQKDITDKCQEMGIRPPNNQEWTFDILNPDSFSRAFNSLAYNEGTYDYEVLNIATQFNKVFFRGSSVKYLSSIVPEAGWTSWAPPDAYSVKKNDYILCVRIHDDIMGVYWVTSSQVDFSRIGITSLEIDSLTTSFTSVPHRGMGPTGSSFYLNRGAGTLNYSNNIFGLNYLPLNEGEDINSTLDSRYADSENAPITMNRSGVQIRHLMKLT